MTEGIPIFFNAQNMAKLATLWMQPCLTVLGESQGNLNHINGVENANLN